MNHRRLLGPIAALVTLAVLGGSGAAVAAWTAAASVSASASSATARTTLTQAGALTTTYAYTGTSSPVVGGTLVLANTGTAPLSYAMATQLGAGSSAVLAQKTTLSLWTGTCGTTIPSAGVVTTTLANPAPALPAAAQSLAPGASVTVCLATRISGADATTSTAALQGQTVTATFRATGSVGTNWTATADAAPITQSVYRLAPATDLTCTNASAGRVTLTWTAPANRLGGTVTYRVFDTIAGRQAGSGTATSLTVGPYDISPNGTFELAVEAKESAYATTAVVSDTVTVIRTSPLDWGLIPTLKCAS